jgi:hypothetical protein
MTTSVDIVNRALEEIASQSQIAALTDQTPEGIAAGDLYSQVVSYLLRQMDPEFARRAAELAVSGGALAYGWSYAFLYPGDCVRLRQIMPATIVPNDPQPVRWSVQNDAGLAATVINTNISPAVAVYTSAAVTESDWNSTFTEAVVRMLASELAMPIGGRPDFAKQKLTEAGGILESAGQRDS